MKRKYIVTMIITALLVLLIIFGARAVDADDGSMFSWRDECGYICYQWADGSGDCYPCLQCEECDECRTPTPDPTPTPPPEPTPEPTPKPKCNRGLGNGSENCDPGNSGGKPGAAGEGNE